MEILIHFLDSRLLQLSLHEKVIFLHKLQVLILGPILGDLPMNFGVCDLEQILGIQIYAPVVYPKTLN